MPWHVARSSQCGPGRPFGVISDESGEVVACHMTEAAARTHVEALYANEPDASRPVLAAQTVPNIELARTGTWDIMTGSLPVTREMLQDAADYASRDGARPVAVRLGHVDPRFDGEPALGWVQNVRVEGPEEDPVLMGDIAGVPDWLSKVLPTAWPDRSMEGFRNVRVGDRVYAMTLDALALLGVTPPGMSTIRSLRDLPQALGVAASGERFAASIHKGSSTKEGAGMDPAKLREALGLSAEASDADVTAALTEAGVVQIPAPPQTQPGTQTSVVPTTGQPQQIAAGTPNGVTLPPVQQIPTTPAPTPPATLPGQVDGLARQYKLPDGVQVVDPSVLASLRQAATAGEEALRRLNEQDMDTTIDEAIRAGKFPPARRDHWRQMWASDPQGAQETIKNLTPGLIPVKGSRLGYPGVSDATADEMAYAQLYGQEG